MFYIDSRFGHLSRTKSHSRSRSVYEVQITTPGVRSQFYPPLCQCGTRINKIKQRVLDQDQCSVFSSFMNQKSRPGQSRVRSSSKIYFWIMSRTRFLNVLLTNIFKVFSFVILFKSCFNVRKRNLQLSYGLIWLSTPLITKRLQVKQNSSK